MTRRGYEDKEGGDGADETHEEMELMRLRGDGADETLRR
jgi:hypothetical protein